MFTALTAVFAILSDYINIRYGGSGGRIQSLIFCEGKKVLPDGPVDLGGGVRCDNIVPSELFSSALGAIWFSCLSLSPP